MRSVFSAVWNQVTKWPRLPWFSAEVCIWGKSRLSWKQYLGSWKVHVRQESEKEEESLDLFLLCQPLFQEDFNRQVHHWRKGGSDQQHRGGGSLGCSQAQDISIGTKNVAPERPFGFEVGLLNQQQGAPQFCAEPKVAFFGGKVWWGSRGRGGWGRTTNQLSASSMSWLEVNLETHKH